MLCLHQYSVTGSLFKFKAALELCTEQLPGKMLHSKENNKEKRLPSGKIFWIISKLWTTVDPVPYKKHVSNFPCWIEI